ncbi:MAG TPA: hypothetical protein DHV22_08075 [Xanthomarina gelatinilytica]|uniref:Uncharacterized protein n=1 Tax=Xanthomarina gelatinilytica TaxID=1137281 RepID=A0A3D6BU29_9FLAO|nr:hypothetical protein [Xanthomarina gelatinilytica]
MSDEVAEFMTLTGKRGKQAIAIQTAYAICKDVDWEKKTMTAIGQSDDLEYYNVRLGNGSIVKKPKPGTLCLIGLIENQAANSFLVDAAEIEEIIITSGETEFTIKEDGFIVKQDGESLKTVLNDLIDKINELNQEVQKIIVIQGTSPSVPDLTQLVLDKTEIKTRLNTILIA